eukprot:jgi/Ulvmu1/4752/UM020_0036.1
MACIVRGSVGLGTSATGRTRAALPCLHSSRARPVPGGAQPATTRPCTPERRQISVHVASPGISSSDKLKAHGAMLSVQAVFALWCIIGHIVLADNDPLVFALARETISSAALLALAVGIEGEVKVHSRKDAIDIFLLGIMAFFVVMGFMFALSDVPEVQVAVAQPIVPALSLGMSAALGMEKLSWVSGLGIFFSVSGAIAFTIFNAEGGAGSAGHAFGYGALALELIAYAAQMTYLPRVSKRYKPITLTAMYYTVATIASAVTLLIRDRHELDQIPSQAATLLSPTLGGALAFAVLGATVFCFTAMSYGSQKLKPSVSSSYITLQPMFVAVLSLVIFGTMLDAKELESGALVLVGLYLSIIGNPSVDRAWQEYMSDLPTNVPQTFTDAAETSASAAAAVKGAVADTVGDVRDTVGDVKETVVEKVEDVALSVQELVFTEKD